MTPIEKRLAAIAKRHRRSVDEITERWTERAAIREHVGGQYRHVAEGEALSDVERELDSQTRLDAGVGFASSTWRTG